jgi:hypothetical protein
MAPRAKPQSGKRRCKAKPPQDYAECAVYDGLKILGSFAPTKGGFAAFDQKGKRLGHFPDANAAREAVLKICIAPPGSSS